MFPFGVTVPATVPQMSKMPEGLKNYPVYKWRSSELKELGWSRVKCSGFHLAHSLLEEAKSLLKI